MRLFWPLRDRSWSTDSERSTVSQSSVASDQSFWDEPAPPRDQPFRLVEETPWHRLTALRSELDIKTIRVLNQQGTDLHKDAVLVRCHAPGIVLPMMLPAVRLALQEPTDAVVQVAKQHQLDGACRRNPSAAGAGAVLFAPTGEVVGTCSHYLPGNETNNTGEYHAMLAGVESAVQHGVQRLCVEGDSHLVLAQVRGTFPCANRRLRRLRDRARARAALRRIAASTLAHIDRRANQHADRLANRALDLKRPVPTADDIEDQLRHVSSSSSPGHDGVGYDVYKRFAAQLTPLLHAAFVACWRHARVPAVWKVGIVRLIHKKGDASVPTNWRPICLQPAIYKLYTGVLTRRLSSWLEANERLPPSQKGFRACSGCAEHQFLATSLVDQARRLHRPLYAVCFVDRVRTLYDDAFFVVANAADGATAPVRREQGVFQGCPLSPLLFIVALAPLLRMLEQDTDAGLSLGYGLRVCAAPYADGIKVFSGGADGIRQLQGVHLGIHESYSYRGLGDGFDHLRHRLQSDDKLRALKRAAVTLLRLELAPHQIVKALKVYVYPKVDRLLVVRNAMKRDVDTLAIQDSSSPQQIWERVRDKYYNRADNVVARGMSKSQVIKRINHVRAQYFGADIHGRVEVAPLSRVKQTTLNFFQFHHVWTSAAVKTETQIDRVIGWANPSLLALLRYGDLTLFVDATFRCVPRMFRQCVVIMVYDKASKLFVPVFYVLMASKTYDAYWNLLQYISDAEGDRVAPTEVVFKQACQRKMSKLCISRAEIGIAMSRGVLDMLTVIEHSAVDPAGIRWVRGEIKHKCLETQVSYSTKKWGLFWAYFRHTWLKLLPPSLWNISGIRRDIVARTNNPLERFNRQLNAGFSSPHPSIAQFVYAIDDISRRYVKLRDDIIRGLAKPPMRETRPSLPSATSLPRNHQDEAGPYPPDAAVRATARHQFLNGTLASSLHAPPKVPHHRHWLSHRTRPYPSVLTRVAAAKLGLVCANDDGVGRPHWPLYAVWCDLRNAFVSLPQKLMWRPYSATQQEAVGYALQD
ncbi:hypothetical protein P43SY_007760 [Pythium insidiosum]|uniref:RNase H type-1 domain-containing protein n=1 Tax=Pythium insidiosum TaxID=114742 RepID=A0AAD5M4D2_PYTIN|nr:hypothetical protein P43SY_007760 [Pythium insidiosum]